VTWMLSHSPTGFTRPSLSAMMTCPACASNLVMIGYALPDLSFQYDWNTQQLRRLCVLVSLLVTVRLRDFDWPPQPSV
jgi:hypothetical protein